MDMLIHSDGTYELYHHGVKGMKWGVRRYQNSDGSLTPAGKKKLDSYKRKELKRNDKKYDAGKYEKRVVKTSAKIDKVSQSGNVKKLKKLQQKQNDNLFNVQYRKGLQAVERSKIMSMTYDQMKSEKYAVTVQRGKDVAESVVVSVAASMILGPAGLRYRRIKITNANKMKTQLRTTTSERAQVRQEAYDNSRRY